MLKILGDFLLNPWTITIGGGLCVVIITYLFFREKREDTSPKATSSSQSNQSVVQTVVVNTRDPSTKDTDKKDLTKSVDLTYLKAKTKILFIEDDVFKKINNLKKFGWSVSQIKDVDNLDTEEIRLANIIFVDYKGVGELSGDQGLGIVRRLKEIYSTNKWIIFYSAHKLPLDVYDKGADSFLAKNATVYEMEQKIIAGAIKVIQ